MGGKHKVAMLEGVIDCAVDHLEVIVNHFKYSNSPVTWEEVVLMMDKIESTARNLRESAKEIIE